MIVAGYTVPAEVEAKLVERMRAGEFTAGQLGLIAASHGVPIAQGLHLHVADRVIQRASRAGHISFWTGGKRLWSWRKPIASPAEVK